MLLSGLPKEYGVLVTILERATEELSLDAILPQLMQVEQRHVMAEDPVKVFGARSNIAFQRTRECYYCGSQDTSKSMVRNASGTKVQGGQLLSHVNA